MRLAMLGAAATAMLLAASGAAGQQAGGRCSLEFENTPNTRLTSTATPSGKRNTYLGGGVIGHCAGQDVTLRSDSAEYYEESNVLYLIGSVHYAEPRVKVDSRRMTYWNTDERLLAEGDVVAVLPSGSTMRGPSAEYFREIPNVRPRARLIAIGRPRMSLVQKDSTGKPAEPVTVVANQVVMDGDSLVFASGKVEIDRTDISARSDSAALDQGREWARLLREPYVEGRGERKFTLRGRIIDVYSKQRQLQRVLASDSAHAVSDELDLRSDTIDMRITANHLERAYAWGVSRARAVSPDRDIIADSLDVVMPQQRVREVRAVRGAFAQTAPDSTKIRSTERDWLRGDTIIARFDSAQTADTLKRPRIRTLVADGHASSFYQIPAQGGPAKAPSINYVRGHSITVAFENQTVNTVTVLEQAAGLYLEAQSDSTTAGKPAAGTTTPRPTPRGRTTPRAVPGSPRGRP